MRHGNHRTCFILDMAFCHLCLHTQVVTVQAMTRIVSVHMRVRQGRQALQEHKEDEQELLDDFLHGRLIIALPYSPQQTADAAVESTDSVKSPRIHGEDAICHHLVQVRCAFDFIGGPECHEQGQQVFVGGMILHGMRRTGAIFDECIEIA